MSAAAAIALAALLLAAAPASARQGDERAEQRFARSLAYLERSPWNERVFDAVLAQAAAEDRVDELLGRYAARLAADAADDGARFLLARLYARTGREDEALALVDGLPAPDAGALVFAGRLELDRGRFTAAVERLDAALAGTAGRLELRALHALRAEARLAAGDERRAVLAFEDMARVEATSFQARLEVAEACAARGLFDAAVAHYAAAEELAAGDPEQLARALVARGGLHEAALDGDAALTAYERALALLARGHWLLDDLYVRVLDLHRRSGRLRQLAARYRARLAAEPRNLGLREATARVLVETGEPREALEVLRVGVDERPDDVDLSRAVRGLLALLSEHDALLAEFQRIQKLRPDDAPLAFDAAEAFLDAGRAAVARQRFRALLDAHPANADLARRAAERWARADDVLEASALYERAIAIEPRAVMRYADLANLLYRAGERDRALLVLERARAAAGTDSGALEELADVYVALEQEVLAVRTLEAAVSFDPTSARKSYRLAELLLGLGETVRAERVLRDVVRLTQDSNLRSVALGDLLELLVEEQRLAPAAAAARRAVDAGSTDPADYLLLAEALEQDERTGDALAVVRALVAHAPTDVDARKRLAALLEQRGDITGALEEYRALISAFPQRKRDFLMRLAALHESRGERGEALAALDAAALESVEHPTALLEVAQRFQSLGQLGRAVRAFERTTRLAPDDAEAWLGLGRAYARAGQHGRVVATLVQAHRLGEPRVQEDAMNVLHAYAAARGTLDAELEGLYARMESSAYDEEAPVLLVALLVREYDYEGAVTVLGKLIELRPHDARLLRQRADLLSRLRRYAEAARDLETLRRLPGVYGDDDALDLIRQKAAAGLYDEMSALAAAFEDPSRVARLLYTIGAGEQALALLRDVTSGSSATLRELVLFGELLGESGQLPEALEVTRRARALAPDSLQLTLRVADLLHKTGSPDEALALVREWVDEPVTHGALQEFLLKRNLGEQWVAMVKEYLLAAPPEGERRDGAQLLAHLDVLRRGQFREGDPLSVIDAVRAATTPEAELADTSEGLAKVPAGYDLAGWVEALDAFELDILSGQPQLLMNRFSQHQTKLSREKQLPPRAWRELAMVVNSGTVHFGGNPIDFEPGLELLPDDPALLEAAARGALERGSFGDAAARFGRLEEALDDAGERLRRELERHRGRIRARAPRAVRGRMTPADLDRATRLTFMPAPRQSTGWNIGPPDPREVARMRVACLAWVGDEAGATAVLDAREAGRDDVAARVDEAALWTELGRLDRARAVYADLWRLRGELLAAPQLAWTLEEQARFADAWRAYAELLLDAGDVLDAYVVLREGGAAARAHAVLLAFGAEEDARARFEEELDIAREQRAGAPADADAAAAYERAGILLAEVHGLCGDRAAQRRVYEELALAGSARLVVLERLAELEEARGEWGAALALREALLAAREAQPDDATRPPGALEPAPLDAEVRGRAARRWDGLLVDARRREQGALAAELLALTRLHLVRGEPDLALERLRRLARVEGLRLEPWAPGLGALLEVYELGASEPELRALLHRADPEDADGLLMHAAALAAAGRTEKAQHVLEGYRASSRRHSELVERALDAALTALE